jgi:hypothetical protein
MLPLLVKVDPDSLRVAELVRVLLPLKTAKSPVVPEPVIPPPLPAQLPVLRQTVAELAPGSGRM